MRSIFITFGPRTLAHYYPMSSEEKSDLIVQVDGETIFKEKLPPQKLLVEPSPLGSVLQGFVRHHAAEVRLVKVGAGKWHYEKGSNYGGAAAVTSWSDIAVTKVIGEPDPHPEPVEPDAPGAVIQMACDGTGCSQRALFVRLPTSGLWNCSRCGTNYTWDRVKSSQYKIRSHGITE